MKMQKKIMGWVRVGGGGVGVGLRGGGWVSVDVNEEVKLL